MDTIERQHDRKAGGLNKCKAADQRPIFRDFATIRPDSPAYYLLSGKHQAPDGTRWPGARQRPQGR